MADEPTGTDIMNQVERIMAVVNTMTSEGKDTNLLNTALMVASGTYATYLATGNDGYLTDSGVDKVAAIYKYNLEKLQDLKKKEA